LRIHLDFFEVNILPNEQIKDFQDFLKFISKTNHPTDDPHIPAEKDFLLI
jgi:hypothetical protein